GKAEPFRIAGCVAVRPLAEHIDGLEFNSITGVAIAVAYWRRRSRAGSAGGLRTAAPTRDGKCPKSRCPLRGPGCGVAEILSTGVRYADQATRFVGVSEAGKSGAVVRHRAKGIIPSTSSCLESTMPDPIQLFLSVCQSSMSKTTSRKLVFLFSQLNA